MLRSLPLCALFLACGRLGYDLLEGGTQGSAPGSGATSSGEGGATNGVGGSMANDGGSMANDGGGTSSDGGSVSGGAAGAGGEPSFAGAPSGEGGAAEGGASGGPGDVGAGGATGCTASGSEVCDGLDNDCANGVDDGVCAADCDGYTYGGHAYVFCSSPLEHTLATAACDGHGMLLVRIDDQAENEWLRSVVYTYTGDNNATAVWRWIGVNDVDDDDVWLWPDGSALSYTRWGGGSPQAVDGCAQMQTAPENPYWNSMPCSQSKAYICELY